MSRRYVDPADLPYGPGNSDYEFDGAQQRLADAFMEGQIAGRNGGPASLCPHDPSEPEWNEWQRGRLLVMGQQLLRKIA